jgi:hypothetical protein
MSNISCLVKGSRKEAIFSVSKWIKHAVLLEIEELRHLMDSLPPFAIYCTACLVSEAEPIERQQFLESYEEYICVLKNSSLEEIQIVLSKYRFLFSSIWTVDSDLLFKMEVGDSRWLIRPRKPVVQLQSHHFQISSLDGELRSMVLGKDSIPWGIQFSYPQIFQDPQTQEHLKTRGEGFPNSMLFSEISAWIRHNSLPTPFSLGEKKWNATIRIGKKCLSWASSYLNRQNPSLSLWKNPV